MKFFKKKRKTTRYSTRVVFHLLRGSQRTNGLLADLSTGGLSFMSSAPLNVKEVVSVLLVMTKRLADGTSKVIQIQTKVVIRWKKNEDEGQASMTVYGAQFEDLSPDNEEKINHLIADCPVVPE